MADLHFHPAELYRRLTAFEHPLEFAARDDALPTLQQGFARDLAAAGEVAPRLATATHFLAVLPDTPWSRRISGTWANRLATANPQRAHAVLVDKGDCYTVSVRAPQERPLIAAVFLNRLARGMRLESDPTVIYGIAGFDGNLRRVHLEDGANPYNTYKIAALPPGPIANPGAAALRAVVEPAESDALFFMSRNDGTHVFSRTFSEHVNHVNRHQKRRRSAP